MKALKRTGVWVLLALSGALLASGCAVTRGQQSVGSYLDDASVTSSVKARFAESRQVDATAISVETLNGEVQLSGFARNATERIEAERLARQVNGVRTVRNQIVVRP